jgi:hypothetical protein
MLQAYRAGLLKEKESCRWTSRIREEWMLLLMQQEADAQLGVEITHMEAAFAPLLDKPGQQMKKWRELLNALAEFKEGNPASLIRLRSRGDLAPLTELWRLMHEQGML